MSHKSDKLRKDALLKNSVEYFNSPEEGFFPISETDANILCEMGAALRRYDIDPILLDIVLSYKVDAKDDAIFKDLSNWNAYHEGISDNKPKKKKKGDDGEEEHYNPLLEALEAASQPVKVIEINGQLIKIGDIKKIQKMVTFTDKPHPVCKIVFNKSPLEGTHNNMEFTMRNEGHMQKVWLDMKEKLSEHFEIIFIN